MCRAESTIVGVVLGIVCPLLTFVILWWTTAVLHLYLHGVPLEVVKTGGLVGLALGVLLDALYLRRWITGFYAARIWLLGAIYVGLSVVAVAFFMGMPVGTFLLGIGGGLYAGRRQRHMGKDRSSAAPFLRSTAVFAATVTTLTALPVGLLVANDPGVLGSVENLAGPSPAHLRGFAGVALVGVLCCVLFFAQFWCSRRAGMVAFLLGGGHDQPTDLPGGVRPDA